MGGESMIGRIYRLSCFEGKSQEGSDQRVAIRGQRSGIRDQRSGTPQCGAFHS